MGHRALVAYERPDELYNLHYSHNGGLNLRLRHAITQETPLGGEESMRRRELFCTQLTGDRRPTVTQGSVDCTRPRTPVDITPLASELTLEAILTEQLNYANHEAFYVVSREFDVTAYRTHWFGLHHVADTAEQSPLHGNGAIRTVRWYDGDPVGDGFARGEFKALKRVVADLLDRDVFSQEQAIQYLEAKLRAWTNDHGELVVRTP